MDSSTELQTVIDYAIRTGGGVVRLDSTKTYTVGTIRIHDARNLTLEGNGAKLILDGENAGFQVVGTNANLTLDGFDVTGDGTVASAQRLVWMWSGTNIDGFTVRNCTVRNVPIGLSVNADLAGTITNAAIEDNTIEDIVGTLSGSGYGIHTAGCDGVTIQRNTIRRCQRHSIYVASGRNIHVLDNVVEDHRPDIPDEMSQRPAVNLSRCQDVDARRNTVRRFRGGGIVAGTDDLRPCQRVLIEGNTLIEPQGSYSPVMVGAPVDDETMIVEDVTVRGNTYTVGAWPGLLVRLLFRCVRVVIDE